MRGRAFVLHKALEMLHVEKSIIFIEKSWEIDDFRRKIVEKSMARCLRRPDRALAHGGEPEQRVAGAHPAVRGRALDAAFFSQSPSHRT